MTKAARKNHFEGAKCVWRKLTLKHRAFVLSLKFFNNSNGVAVGDLYLEGRRLLATTHPASIVAAMFAMDNNQLNVTTSVGNHAGEFSFPSEDEEVALVALKLRMNINPELYQFTHLSSTASEKQFLEGLDVFSQENWHHPNDTCDEYIRIAHHHLPTDVIKRRLTKPAPSGWKKTLAIRNEFVYFPFC